ncbi:hypothetical protein A5704_07780 [Mycobacterium sp. E735]|nr:hypothetical protein A5704_07780 [Mycobacterium sp. E735]OBG76711.1 hypothetical protein A5701_18775 [Mycobacterium sp. E3305]
MVDDVQRALGPSNVLFLERDPTQQRQIGADPLGMGQKLPLGVSVEYARPQAFVALQFGRRPLQALDDELPHGGCVPGVRGLDLDEQFVANRRGLGRPRGELPDRVVAGLGQREQPLVWPALLLHDARPDEALLGKAVEFAVQLLGGGHPEIRHRGVEVLGEVVSGRLALEEGRQDSVTQRHRRRVQRYE